MDFLTDINLWLTLATIGFIAGFIDAIAGGGGMLTVPTLLTAGLPPHIALGTNKLAATFGSFTASYTYFRKRLFDPVFWRHAIIMTAVGAIAGTLAVNFLSTDFLEKVLPIVIISTAIYTLCAKSSDNIRNSLPSDDPQLKLKQTTQGTILGFYDGVAGPGTGAFWMTSSSVLYRMNILLCSGLARSTNFVSNFCSLCTFLYLGQVNIMLGIVMGVFIMFGAWFGAHSAIKFGAKFIRPAFTLIVILLSVNLAYHAWQ